MGPDKGLCCTIYEALNCNGKGWVVVKGFHWPGIKYYARSHLLVINNLADEGIGSVKCAWKSEDDCPS
jgi:hypothetical protein